MLLLCVEIYFSWLWDIVLCIISSFFNPLDDEEGAGYFHFIVFLLLCVCLCQCVYLVVTWVSLCLWHFLVMLTCFVWFIRLFNLHFPLVYIESCIASYTYFVHSVPIKTPKLNLNCHNS